LYGLSALARTSPGRDVNPVRYFGTDSRAAFTLALPATSSYLPVAVDGFARLDPGFCRDDDGGRGNEAGLTTDVTKDCESSEVQARLRM
jgi:hypothetical protein